MDNNGSTRQGMDAPLSVSELSSRCCDDAETVRMLLDEFEQELRSDIEAMESGLRAGDAASVARVAHALRGAAGAAAAARLGALAEMVETYARANALESLHTELKTLRQEVERCLAYIPKVRETCGSSGGSQGG